MREKSGIIALSPVIGRANCRRVAPASENIIPPNFGNRAAGNRLDNSSNASAWLVYLKGLLVLEVPFTSQNHRRPGSIDHLQRLLIPHRSARVNNCRYACIQQ
jgi:hypothetical protein